MSVCSCVNGSIYNGSVTTDPLCPVHGEKAVVACSYPLCPIHFPPNRAPHPAEPTIGLSTAQVMSCDHPSFTWEQFTQNLNVIVRRLLDDAFSDGAAQHEKVWGEPLAKLVRERDAAVAYEHGLAEQIEKRLRALVQRIRPKPDALMEYDGDNHGDTATAASNSTAEWIAHELEVILGPEVRP